MKQPVRDAIDASFLIQLLTNEFIFLTHGLSSFATQEQSERNSNHSSRLTSLATCFSFIQVPRSKILKYVVSLNF